MHDNIPANDSIILPEGVVEDDPKVLWLNHAFADIVSGEPIKEEEKNERGTE
ncbi:MAG: hypothetical protein IJZ81_05245 [Clostridia bacterium]|nr:hypothetical protein [Clostridia bacterium]